MSTARGQQRLYSGAFIPYGSRLNQSAANAVPLPEDAGAIDPPNLTGEYAGPSYTDRTLPVKPLPYSQPGPQVQINPNAGGVMAVGNQNPYSGYPNNPFTGNFGYGAPGGTFEPGGYNDPSDTFWPNTTNTSSPSIWSKLLAGGGKALLGVSGSILGGALGPAGSLAGGIAGKMLGNKLIHAPQGTSTFNPGGPMQQNPFIQIPGGTFDASGGYQEPGENGRYWPATRESTAVTPPTTFANNGQYGPNGQNYGQSTQQADLALMSQQANGGAPNNMGWTGDAGHDRFGPGEYKRMMDEEGNLVPTTEKVGHNFHPGPSMKAEAARLGHPTGLLSYGPVFGGGSTGNVGPANDPFVSDATKRFLANLAARRAGGIG